MAKLIVHFSGLIPGPKNGVFGVVPDATFEKKHRLHLVLKNGFFTGTLLRNCINNKFSHTAFGTTYLFKKNIFSRSLSAFF